MAFFAGGCEDEVASRGRFCFGWPAIVYSPSRTREELERVYGLEYKVRICRREAVNEVGVVFFESEVVMKG